MLLALWGVVPSAAMAAPHAGARITDNLYDAHFTTANEGWVVGGFGTIFHTRDGGDTWQQQVSRTAEQLYGVDFADAQNGWVVGRTGIILHTKDGGNSWEAQKSGNEKHLFTVAALDPQRAWAVGDWGVILATRDSGKTWEDRSLTRDVVLYGQSWPDAQHGWIVGEAGAILATADGGATWTDQPSGIEKTLFGVSFRDPANGWAVGLDGIILHTADGGQTWQAQRGDTTVGALEQVGAKEAFENPSLYGIAVAGQYAYAVGDNGSVFASDDGGQTWKRKDVPAEANLRWIRAATLVSGTHGLFVGADGLTMRVAADTITVPQKESHAPETTH